MASIHKTEFFKGYDEKAESDRKKLIDEVWAELDDIKANKGEEAYLERKTYWNDMFMYRT